MEQHREFPHAYRRTQCPASSGAQFFSLTLIPFIMLSIKYVIIQSFTYDVIKLPPCIRLGGHGAVHLSASQESHCACATRHEVTGFSHQSAHCVDRMRSNAPRRGDNPCTSSSRYAQSGPEPDLDGT